MDIKQIEYGVSGIYKIIFSNDKMYIGLSNDIRRRMIEHIGKDLTEKPNLLISKAIIKHGIKSVEIIEEIPENDREKLINREKYWIKYFNTFEDRTRGYNMTPGGDGAYPGLYNPSSYLSQEELDQIFNLLLNSSLTYNEIADQTNSSYSIVSRINNGTHYRNNQYEYPLRKKRVNHYGIENKTGSFYNDKEKLLNLVSDLKFTNLSYNELCNKYKISQTTLVNINSGKIYKIETEIYPLRPQRLGSSHKRIFTEDELIYIKESLQKQVAMNKIAEKLKCDRKVISDINSGKRQKNENWKYPLKNN